MLPGAAEEAGDSSLGAEAPDSAREPLDSPGALAGASAGAAALVLPAAACSALAEDVVEEVVEEVTASVDAAVSEEPLVSAAPAPGASELEAAVVA